MAEKLFSGLLINMKDLDDWLKWVRFLSIFRYSLNALGINEMKDRSFCNNATDCAYGNEYLEQQGIPYKTSLDLWINHIGLGSIVVLFMFLAYVQLRRIQKLK